MPRPWRRGGACRRYCRRDAGTDRIKAEEGRQILHPFNDLNMLRGAATCGAEFIEDVPDLDIVILPVGGGGLISGMAAAIKRQRPDITIIGVEPVGGQPVRSFRSGAPEVLDKVDTITASAVPRWQWPNRWRLPANMWTLIQIEDSVMRNHAAMRERLTLMVEPACAASLGAALGLLRDRLRGKRQVIACGSNISMARFDAFTADAEMPDAANREHYELIINYIFFAHV